MLINQRQEGEGGRPSEVGSPHGGSNSHEYQTANELYEMIAKNHPFDPEDTKSLTTQDLVILYKNIEIGTKLLSNNSYDFKSKTPNQYVESVVYKDEPDSDGSDVSEIYSNEELNNVFMINSERIDFFNNIPSYDNSLCQKFGNIDMQSSKLAAEYDKHFLFSDPFIKEQFKSLNNISKSKHSDSSVLPTSLLDYICCKRLEDNYNFYMDNIIQYVKHTIDQLKRISNGDYLTERVKEKWREVDNRSNNTDYKSTVLASSNSIPFHVEEKLNGNKSTWDDIVHSEMDIRSLSKILEKKIVVEVPKLLCGSFKLFSKRYKNSLFIRCKKDKRIRNEDEREKSRVDVILQLKRSESGHVISNIDSVMILKTGPIQIIQTEAPNKMLALQFNEFKGAEEESDARLKIVELAEDNDILETGLVLENMNKKLETLNQGIEEVNYKPRQCYDEQNDGDMSTIDGSITEQTEANFSLFTPDELHCTMRRLSMQLPVLEELEDACTKRKKSPRKVRIKSPYENKSFIMEEKKRKKLLEIREKREKKKNSLNESSKITKHRYGKGVIMPQPSSSVTKLSITNKSFYNSIYGQSVNSDPKTLRKCKGPKGDSISTLDLHHGEEDCKKDSSLLTPEKNSQKYINRSYYLDDAETEVMYMQMKKNGITEEVKNPSISTTSQVSNETSHNFALFKQFIDQSVTDLSITDTSSSLQPNVIIDETFLNKENKNQGDMSTNCNRFIVPTNTPKLENGSIKSKNDIPPTVRKSIEKVYDLIKAISKTDPCGNEVERSQPDVVFGKLNVGDVTGEISTIQASDSGTSIKHQLTSSNPSCYSFDKTTTEVTTKKFVVKKNEQPANVIPKVIISSKTQTGREKEKNDKKNKKYQPDVPKNPLKAISQLLHEFDHVQKTRHKYSPESKTNKKSDSTSEGKAGFRPFSRKTSHQEHHSRINEPASSRGLIHNERRARHSPGKESSKTIVLHNAMEEKCVDKGNKKKLADFIDEVKEFNGEAVRGPPKRSSRLNSLAQPKKSYVQAHHEEYHSRYGRNIVSERLQKLASAPTPIQERTSGATNYRSRQRRGSEVLTGATKQVHSSGPCLGAKARRSASNSPDGNEKRSSVLVNGPSYNYSNVPETSEPLNKKMVAVETYVKSHFGHVSPALEQSDCQVRKSRVPLIPTDFDLVSLTSSPNANESTALGNKLHYIINSMVSNLPALTALTECNESSSKLNKHDVSVESSSKCDEIVSCSDYPVDVFEDKNIVTVVESILNNKDDEIVDDEADANDQNYDKDKFCSTDELQMLENALYNQLSNGSFQKRLRIKNLTLTPKQSVQHFFVLQSGDSRSMFLKSSMSQKIDNLKTDTLTELSVLPRLSKPHIGWEFSKFPLQIATVGYAFSEMKPVECSSTSQIKSVDDYNRNCEIVHTLSKNNIHFSKSTNNTSFSKSTTQLQCSCENQLNKIKVENTSHLRSDNKTGTFFKEQNIKKSITVKENSTHLQDNNDVITKVATSENADNVGYSTSLDILMGLLNEIKKITGCQANFGSPDNNDDKTEIDLERKELEIILNKAADRESSKNSSLKNIVSQATLGSLGHLGLNCSNYSLLSHKSNVFTIDKQIVTSDMNLPYFNKTLTVDKEINVNTFEKQWIHQYTEVVELFPITVNQSTKITDSLMKITTKSSSQSVYFFDDCQTIQTSPDEESNRSFVDSSKVDYSMTCPKQRLADYRKENSVHKITEYVIKSKQSKNKGRILSQENNKFLSELDQSIKLKRDILVTVYSILVFTVFAALSFDPFVY